MLCSYYEAFLSSLIAVIFLSAGGMLAGYPFSVLIQVFGWDTAFWTFEIMTLMSLCVVVLLYLAHAHPVLAPKKLL